MTEIKERTHRIIITATAIAMAFFAAWAAKAQTPGEWEKMKGNIAVFMANDTGRNGYYDQRTIAELMGNMAETIGPECIVAAGDIHHFNGVASVNDPLWTTNYETVYSHPELMIDWFPVLGNHEYRGCTKAVMDYSKVSRRWMSGKRYYSKVFEDDGITLRIVFIDTTPLIEKYRNETDKYPDACKQDADRQLAWLDSTLACAKEKWIVVVGHHPIYADTPKADSERADMQKALLPIFHKYDNVDIYACGHIHNFQHIRMKNDDIDYVVNSAASLSRDVKPTTGTQFCSSEPGFSVISASSASLCMHFIDKTGKILHSVKRVSKK